MTLVAKNVSFAYTKSEPVLRQVSHKFEQGRSCGVFGPNGSGKTTLLRCLNNNLAPDAGEVSFDGTPLASLGRAAIASLIAVVPQEIFQPPPFTVFEAVMMGRFHRWKFLGGESEEDRVVVEKCLRRLDLEKFSEKPLCALSGGERQRAMIARALAQETPVLLMDEPAAHLDMPHQITLFKILKELAAEGKTVVAVCHDLFAPPLFLDDAILLDRGTLAASGPAQDVLSHENIREVFGVKVEIKWSRDASLAAKFF